MSGYIEQPDYWNQNPQLQQDQQHQQDSYNFEMPVQQDFGQELNFQSFESSATQNYGNEQPAYPVTNPYLSADVGGFQGYAGATAADEFGGNVGEYEDEPPLLEELGINPDFIIQKDLQTFLDEAKNGTVYLSFGSNIKSSQLPKDKIELMLDTFSELPYNVLWKFEAQLDNIPKNVQVRKWLPQQDILRHSNVKLFIMQGGLQSLDEAVHNAIPVVVIPFFGDQPSNSARIKDAGIGLPLDFATLTKEGLTKTINEVINNKEFKETAKKLSNIAQDQPMSGLEKVIWWTEYVIRHKGAYHLRSPAVGLPFYQYFMLDVIGFLTIAFLISSYIFVKLSKLLLKTTHIL